MDSTTDQVLDIEIDWETCTITAHLEGFPDPIKCKETLLKLLEPFGDFREFAFTSTFDDDSADPNAMVKSCLLYTSPSPRDATLSRMPSSA